MPGHVVRHQNVRLHFRIFRGFRELPPLKQRSEEQGIPIRWRYRSVPRRAFG